MDSDLLISSRFIDAHPVEAARILDAPVPTVKTWIRRARLKLARAYAQKESES